MNKDLVLPFFEVTKFIDYEDFDNKEDYFKIWKLLNFEDYKNLLEEKSKDKDFKKVEFFNLFPVIFWNDYNNILIIEFLDVDNILTKDVILHLTLSLDINNKTKERIENYNNIKIYFHSYYEVLLNSLNSYHPAFNKENFQKRILEALEKENLENLFNVIKEEYFKIEDWGFNPWNLENLDYYFYIPAGKFKNYFLNNYFISILQYDYILAFNIFIQKLEFLNYSSIVKFSYKIIDNTAFLSFEYQRKRLFNFKATASIIINSSKLIEYFKDILERVYKDYFKEFKIKIYSKI